MATEAVTWLRPEFEGRESELITLAEGADLVGVTRSAVSNWAARHATFPRLVLLTGTYRKRTKFVVRAEFLAFARQQLTKPTGSPGRRKSYSPRRPAVVVRGIKEQPSTTEAEHRVEVVAERDAEIVAWLGKKAREYPSAQERQESVPDAIARLADKIQRGAVRGLHRVTEGGA